MSWTKGVGGVGPNLTTGVFYHGGSDAELRDTISNGVPGTAMPSSIFGDTQLGQLVAFIRSLQQATPSVLPPGNPVRGNELVKQSGCLACHTINGEGGSRGPDLSTIGSARSPAYLRQSIVDPNAEVAPQYYVINVSMNDGKQYSGFLMNEDTYALQLLDFNIGLTSITRSGIKTAKTDKSSLMPSFKAVFGKEDLDDIVSYLSSLRLKVVSH